MADGRELVGDFSRLLRTIHESGDRCGRGCLTSGEDVAVEGERHRGVPGPGRHCLGVDARHK
jgi:hypothetical protein